VEVIVGFIDENRDELGVEPICADLQVAPSTYYAAKSRPPSPSARARRDAVMIPILLAMWQANYSVYGAHKLWKAARRVGHDIGRDQVARLTRQAGIRGVKRGRRVITTKRDDSAPRSPDLVKRNFTASAPNQLWVTDFKCRRRHFMSYADPRNMPTVLAMVQASGSVEVQKVGIVA
jgi:putative transposase